MEINDCRICHSSFTTLLNLNDQKIGSYFPLITEDDPISVPLVLVKCDNQECGLVQLKHTTSSDILYLSNQYGYRSGLNNTMISHLTNLVNDITSKVQLNKDDIVLDIGSNDATLLKAYPTFVKKVGCDPTGKQFKQYYTDDITLIEDFFSSKVFKDKAKIITTISMFYDLPDPLSFAKDIKDSLDEKGVWVTEQSYCGTMLDNNSFDTICHEHLEYYFLKQIDYIAKQVGLQIFDVNLNSCNGGSFRVYLSHLNSYPINDSVNKMLEEECRVYTTLTPFYEFVERIEENKRQLLTLLNDAKRNDKIIYLYGASTKGNTLLQYYGIDHTLITAAAERNPDKYGHCTPGTRIPIVSEKNMRQAKPDYLL